ncbi:MAG: AraC family transcriptional regulator [Thermodesulfobacteriota bacterium]|nr:MAG: AraC family transcriptional regulator [Thermodesulfobacteriota bacterium]
MQKITVGIFIYDDVEVLDFTGPYEVFSVTRTLEQPNFTDPCPFEILLVSEHHRKVKTMSGMRVVPNHDFDDFPSVDILIIPGGLGERREHNNAIIHHFLKSQAKKVKTLASVCTGALFLANAALLNGKKATTHILSLDRLEEGFPEIKVIRDKRYVEDGNIITSAGISAGIDMSLFIVAKYLGEDVARLTAREMEYPYPENDDR